MMNRVMLDLDRLPSDEARRYLNARLRNVPDFPKPGILFKDITPLLADPRAFQMTLDLMTAPFVGEKIDVVLGIESRGFIFGGALAARLGSSFVPVRKPGKLPYKSRKIAYKLEYGEAELEMHIDAVESGARVLIVDDVLATGGTAAAATSLVLGAGGQVAGFAFPVELDFLKGRTRLEALVPQAVVYSLLRFAD